MDHDDDRDRKNEMNELRRALLALLPGLALGDAASAQDAAKMQPAAYTVSFENDRLRVLDYRSKPGMGVCGNGVHSHPAHLTVVLTDGKVRGRRQGGDWQTGDGKIGDVFWSEAETHEVENISGRNLRALLIELKPGAARS
jgi:hypothetical protein